MHTSSNRFDFIWSSFLADPLVPDAASGADSILQECPLSPSAYTYQVPDPAQIFIEYSSSSDASASDSFTESPVPLANSTRLDDSLPSSSDPSLSVLRFILGRRNGKQAVYDGFIYTKDRVRPCGTVYWQCKDRKDYSPTCKSRLFTNGAAPDSTVIRSTEHNHPPSLMGVRRAELIQKIKRDVSLQKPGWFIIYFTDFSSGFFGSLDFH